jgi:phage gp36-like protein
MYSSKEQVLAKCGQFANLITADMSDTAIEAFITEADNMIDGYLVGAVTLPFTTVPKLITTISVNIAVRNLWAQNQAKSVPEHVKADYDNAIKLLELIAKGTLKLSSQDPAAEDFRDLKYTVAPRQFLGQL